MVTFPSMHRHLTGASSVHTARSHRFHVAITAVIHSDISVSPGAGAEPT